MPFWLWNGPMKRFLQSISSVGKVSLTWKLLLQPRLPTHSLFGPLSKSALFWLTPSLTLFTSIQWPLETQPLCSRQPQRHPSIQENRYSGHTRTGRLPCFKKCLRNFESLLALWAGLTASYLVDLLKDFGKWRSKAVVEVFTLSIAFSPAQYLLWLSYMPTVNPWQGTWSMQTECAVQYIGTLK